MNVVIYSNNTVCVNGKLFRDIDSEKFMKKISKKLKPILNDVYDKRVKLGKVNYMIFRKKENVPKRNSYFQKKDNMKTI